MGTYILSNARTPIGSFLGSLSNVPATGLGSVAIEGALKKSGLDASLVELVVMGQAVQAGSGQAPARQAALGAGCPKSTMAMTINKVCGSGMQAIISASQAINAGDVELAISGGMENMSMAPHLLPSSRTGVKFGETKMRDSMQWDGLWDVYSNRPMGNCAEECVAKYEVSREEMDEFSINSYKRSQQSIGEGKFDSEIVPVTIPNRKGDLVVDKDEEPFKTNFEKVPNLRPAFEKTGSITAANASTINDGAAALVIGGEKYKDKARFKITAYAGHAQEPTWFTTAPVEAMKKCLVKSGLEWNDIDLFEINEAFAVVTMAAMKELSLDNDRVNILGGAVSLGHPIGCSGARIVSTLMTALDVAGKSRGMASICIGGGEALALMIERV